jgi:hypothetical protein
MNKFIITAVCAALLSGCATYQEPAYTSSPVSSVRQEESEYSARKVLALNASLPQLIEETAGRIDPSKGAQAMMGQLDALGWLVYAKAPACVEELSADPSELPNCHDYLMHLAAMMSVGEAAKPLMQRNPNMAVQTTGGFTKAGDVIEPVGAALAAYWTRNF